jgi:hypothetical protein
MTTSNEIKNTLSFITDILNQDVLPYFDQANHEYSVTDMTAILSKFLILQQSIVNLEGTFDQKISLIESPIIREINVLADCQTVVIPDLDILFHGGSYEIEYYIKSKSASASPLLMLLNDDVSEALYRSQYTNLTTSASSAQSSNCTIGYVYGNQFSTGSFNLLFVENEKISYSGIMGGYGGTAYFTRVFSGQRNDILMNINSITLYSSFANGIGAGSKIIIRRKDV